MDKWYGVFFTDSDNGLDITIAPVCNMGNRTPDLMVQINPDDLMGLPADVNEREYLVRYPGYSEE